MDRLFSPWRSEYIDSFKNKKSDPSHCIFCEALNSSDDDKHLVFARRAEAFAIMNLYPYNSAHVMIVPNRHCGDFLELTESELADVMKLVQETMKAISEIVKPDGYNLGMNLGRSAGAGIDNHLHLHIVPRWTGDTNFMPTLADVKLVSDDIVRHAVELRKRLR